MAAPERPNCMSKPEAPSETMPTSKASKWFPILLIVGIIAYVTISGTTRSCPTCTVITEGLGIPSLVDAK